MRHSSTQLLFVADARLETSFRASFSELNFDAALQFCRQIGCRFEKGGAWEQQNWRTSYKCAGQKTRNAKAASESEGRGGEAQVARL